MQTPPTIKEEGDATRWIVENARPRAMRVVIGGAAPIVIGLVGVAAINDFHEHSWGMLTVRVIFAAIVGASAIFSLFGSESLAIEGSELVWRRGRSLERRCAVGDVAKLERQGNHLRIHVRGQETPIVVGAGLRQRPAAIQWLAERIKQRLTDTITAARKGT